jgi:hypothetical protein
MVYCDSTINVEDARGRGNRLIHTRGIESIHICRLLASKHTMQYELMVVHSGINQTYYHSTRITAKLNNTIFLPKASDITSANILKNNN